MGLAALVNNLLHSTTGIWLYSLDNIYYTGMFDFTGFLGIRCTYRELLKYRDEVEIAPKSSMKEYRKSAASKNVSDFVALIDYIYSDYIYI